jgi:hypothetical protein
LADASFHDLCGDGEVTVAQANKDDNGGDKRAEQHGTDDLPGRNALYERDDQLRGKRLRRHCRRIGHSQDLRRGGAHQSTLAAQRLNCVAAESSGSHHNIVEQGDHGVLTRKRGARNAEQADSRRSASLYACRLHRCKNVGRLRSHCGADAVAIRPADKDKAGAAQLFGAKHVGAHKAGQHGGALHCPAAKRSHNGKTGVQVSLVRNIGQHDVGRCLAAQRGREPPQIQPGEVVVVQVEARGVEKGDLCALR